VAAGEAAADDEERAKEQDRPEEPAGQHRFEGDGGETDQRADRKAGTDQPFMGAARFDRGILDDQRVVERAVVDE
jgi:hypothetical protein